MRGVFPTLLMLLASQADAQSFASMGRLFTTPAERAQLDTQRSQAPAIALSARSGPPGNLPGASATMPCAAVSAPGCPPKATATVEGAAGAPDAGPGASDQGTLEAPGLRLDGVIRRSSGPTVLIVNGEVQPAPAGGVMRGAVTMQAGGRPIVLKPGQRYDPATGEVHEAAR